jgi:tRNA pseudouridine38-40 synthase
MRIALGIAYDGSGFAGWQSQASGDTVQDHLERALAGIAGAPIRVTAAGRTDAGVHATGQVAHCDTPADRPESAWVRGTNSALPAGIAVQWAQPVDSAFHARFAATARTYHYVLYVHPVRPALFGAQVGWFHLPLDLVAMQRAAVALVGQHDFSSFRAAECQAKSPVRTLHELTLAQRGAYIVFKFRADAFLHRMVRNIVGALVYVGKGHDTPESIAALLAARDRRLAAPTFSPAGLYLTKVEYDPAWSLPETSPALPWITAP